MKKSILALLFLGSFSLHLQAQDIPQKLKQAKWVKIMSNDTAYNFLEADAAFQKYYTAYLKEKKQEAVVNQTVNAHAAEEHKDVEELLVGQYLKWSVGIRPFVLPDGRIMPVEQRLAIIKEVRSKQRNQ